MRTYPKYLKTMPSFLGLFPSDLFGIAVALILSSIFGFSQVWTLLIAIVLVGLGKAMRRYVDIVGLMLPWKKTIYIKGDVYDSSL